MSKQKEKYFIKFVQSVYRKREKNKQKKRKRIDHYKCVVDCRDEDDGEPVVSSDIYKDSSCLSFSTNRST